MLGAYTPVAFLTVRVGNAILTLGIEIVIFTTINFDFMNLSSVILTIIYFGYGTNAGISMKRIFAQILIFLAENLDISIYLPTNAYIHCGNFG